MPSPPFQFLTRKPIGFEDLSVFVIFWRLDPRKWLRLFFACWCSAGNEGMAPINHFSWCPFAEPVHSISHSPTENPPKRWCGVARCFSDSIRPGRATKVGAVQMSRSSQVPPGPQQVQLNGPESGLLVALGRQICPAGSRPAAARRGPGRAEAGDPAAGAGPGPEPRSPSSPRRCADPAGSRGSWHKRPVAGFCLV